MSAHNSLKVEGHVRSRSPEFPPPQPSQNLPPRFSRHIPPGLFASVMGTGIVATLAGRFDEYSPVFRHFGTGVWALAALWLATLSIALAGHWILHPRAAAAAGRSSGALPFYGTVPMAILTVGSGALVYGPAVFGSASGTVAASLWIVGTVLGLATAIGVPIAAVLSAQRITDHALPCWILPVVPPMVSATTGAGLLDLAGSGSARTALQALCYGLFGMALILALLTLGMIYHRLMGEGTLAAAAVPTIWIPLGVIGQSVAAANLLGISTSATTLSGVAVGPLVRTVGIGFGVTMLGFAVFWVLFAAALTAHGTSARAPFSLSWWSLVFPVGAMTLGLSALAEASDSRILELSSLGFYAVLVVIWAAVALRSVAGGHLAWWRTH